MVNYIFDAEQDYFHWLCEMVHIDQLNARYWLLAKDLHRHPFYSIVNHDENRASDGMELREEYLREINYPKYISLDGECSVFEMIIALARRMDFETTDPYSPDEGYDKTSYWFWEMMENLGLIIFSDDVYVEYGGVTQVDNILETMLHREYREDGHYGGLFPLEECSEDQREIEIWYQMCAYLMEREAV